MAVEYPCYLCSGELVSPHKIYGMCERCRRFEGMMIYKDLGSTVIHTYIDDLKGNHQEFPNAIACNDMRDAYFGFVKEAMTQEKENQPYVIMELEGIKHDTEKLPEHLYSIDAHNQLLEVLKFGAGKYSERNWEKGMDWSRVYAAAERHLHAWWNGKDKDEETGLSHLAHAMCCVMFLLHYEKNNSGTDDRVKNNNG